MKRTTGRSKPQPSWSDVKRQLTDWDRAALLGLIGDLYGSSKDNQAFLHARLNLGDDPLGPYKDTIARWAYPDLMENQKISVVRAKKAVSDFRKANGDETDLLELMTFFCEQAAAFSTDIGLDDEEFYNALVRMFGEALNMVAEVPLAQRARFLDRLRRVGQLCSKVGYGIGDDMQQLLNSCGQQSKLPTGQQLGVTKRTAESVHRCD